MDLNTVDSYTHTPLEDASCQIRLLRIHPGDGDEIHCTIAAYDVASAPEYSAVSYTWGPRENPKTIWIDSKPFKVTQNCHCALWQARLHFPYWQAQLDWLGNFVWIDSVCIQQSNLSEKGEQVGMMGDMYGHSALVFACVGAHDETSRLLMESIENLFPAFDNHCRGNRMSFLPTITEQTLSNLNRWLKPFASRPYWSRLWILQEMQGGMPHHNWILCGDSMLMYHHLHTIILSFRQFYDDGPLSTWFSHWRAYDFLKSNQVLMVSKLQLQPTLPRPLSSVQYSDATVVSYPSVNR